VLSDFSALVETARTAGLVLFDLDNTLLDREAAFAKWASIFVNNHGLSLDAWSVIESADEDGLRPRDQFFEVLRASLPIETSVDDLLDSYHDEYPQCYTVSEETLDAIRRLRASGWKVGVVTNGPPSQMLKIEITNLAQEFDAICVSSIVGSRKPERGIFEEAARVCDVPLNGGWSETHRTPTLRADAQQDLPRFGYRGVVIGIPRPSRPPTLRSPPSPRQFLRFSTDLRLSSLREDDE